MYIVALIGLIPLGLRIIDSLAARGGSVTTPWVSLDFSVQVSPHAHQPVEIPVSLGQPGVPINDSSAVAVHQTVNQAEDNHIVRLDLGNGESWWMTRLFALCAGAAWNTAPHVLLFVGVDRGIQPAFLGWVRPPEALRLLRSHREFLRVAQDRAQEIARWVTSPGTTGLPPPVPERLSAPLTTDPLLTPLAVPAQDYLLNPQFQGLGEETALRVLLDLLGRYEQVQVPLGGERVTVGRLHDLFGNVLHDQVIDTSWSKERRVEEFLGTTEDYVAITSNRVFERVVHRRVLENALVRQLLTPRNGESLQP